jgi:hypothetical protein
MVWALAEAGRMAVSATHAGLPLCSSARSESIELRRLRSTTHTCLASANGSRGSIPYRYSTPEGIFHILRSGLHRTWESSTSAPCYATASSKQSSITHDEAYSICRTRRALSEKDFDEACAINGLIATIPRLPTTQSTGFGLAARS